MATRKGSETPLMRQYNQFKSQHPDALLLFRMGDFYETFGEDAKIAASILGITLTKRANGAAAEVELAGFPYHAIDNYLPKLVRAGQRVAICEQLEDPKLAKTIVKRGVTELVTPGVVLNDNVLENKENNFLACVYLNPKLTGLALLDISTGEFLVSEGDTAYIDRLLNHFSPKEVLIERGCDNEFKNLYGSKFFLTPMEDWAFKYEIAREKLINQFQTINLKGYGVDDLTAGITAAGAILQYLSLTVHDKLGHINKIQRISEDKFVWLDKFTIRNLELLYPSSEGGTSLCSILDKTITPMGGRLLRRWISMPLKNLDAINERLSIVQFLTDDTKNSDDLRALLKQVGDLERLVAKLASGRISPREVVQLRTSLHVIPELKSIAKKSNIEPLKKVAELLDPCSDICKRIANELREDAPQLVSKGNVFKHGVNIELDELKSLQVSSQTVLFEIQEAEKRKTGIPSLKVAFNNVFGYYIEVSNAHKTRVPLTWVRKQTLVNAERYITEELKALEQKILGAGERILVLETSLFEQLLKAISPYIPAMQLNASLLAQLDCLQSYAQVAVNNKYTRPKVTDADSINIKQGRHPVIECCLPADSPYVANDLVLNTTDQQIIVLTGPNMAGKSALLRQTALIVLMAQIGSFVPAESAEIGYVDKIFTRVGASDNLSMGESTFMVEMTEAAGIMNNLSARSLVLLDEIGRGTSTYDGISIAWAMAEYIHEHPQYKAKTLFATHYHELNELEASFSRIKNYTITVREVEGKVLFLRRLVRGGTEHSFGIHVAKIAGMPNAIVNKANDILKSLETSRTEVGNKLKDNIKQLKAEHSTPAQLPLTEVQNPLLSRVQSLLKDLDINNITPMDALHKLHELQSLLNN